MTSNKSHGPAHSQLSQTNWRGITASSSLLFQEWDKLFDSLSNICESLTKPLTDFHSKSQRLFHYLEQINKSEELPDLDVFLGTSKLQKDISQLFQKVADIDKQLSQIGLDQAKIFHSLESSIVKSLKPFSNTNSLLNTIVNRPIKLLNTPRTEELLFNLRRLEKCKAYFGKIDSKTPIREILKSLEGVPEEEYGNVLLSKFGRSKKRGNARRVKRQAKKIFNYILYLYSLYTFLAFLGIPLPASFPEFIEVIFQQPVQSIQQTKQNPPISKGFDKQLLVASSRKRKKRSHKYRRK